MVWKKIMDGGNQHEFLARAAIPALCMREGYCTSVALFAAQYSHAGPYAYASLLLVVRITKWQFILQL